jgi:transcriptional regulator with XRE-family HTH domain
MNKIKKLNRKQVAKNAYKMIIESKYSIESVALSLNISERLIYYWQEGRRSPNVEHVYGLSQLFGVSVESILD